MHPAAAAGRAPSLPRSVVVGLEPLARLLDSLLEGRELELRVKRHQLGVGSGLLVLPVALGGVKDHLADVSRTVGVLLWRAEGAEARDGAAGMWLEEVSRRFLRGGNDHLAGVAHPGHHRERRVPDRHLILLADRENDRLGRVIVAQRPLHSGRGGKRGGAGLRAAAGASPR